MSDTALYALAQQAGVLTEWHDWQGVARRVAPDTLRAVLAALELPCATPAQIAESRGALAEAPAPDEGTRPAVRAPAVSEFTQREHPWGAAVQLYALRRPHDGGLGDFTALADLARALGRAGADALALSPVHAPLLAEPARCSPYTPSNRLMLNPLYIDPAQAARSLGEALHVDAALADACARLEAAPLVDWPEAARVRLTLLRALYEDVAARIVGDQEFDGFRMHGERAMEDHARFEVLHAHQLARGASGDWRTWPAALRDPRSRAVREFAREHAHEVTWQFFLQWQADRGLYGAQAAARFGGMSLGLIGDLAVGTDPAGSHAWSDPHVLLRGLSLGAPPDALNARGQDWGLTTFSPRVLARTRGAPLVEVLQAALRHAGGVRIDHVLGLNRIWVIPAGAAPTEGAYLRCPLEPLLDRVAREARARNAVIIGEDLGTVPPELAPALAAAGVLGLRVLWFMRDAGGFVPPDDWPATAVAATSTHDLPTIAGWWQARDIDWRERIGHLDAGAAAREREARARDRENLWRTFRGAGLANGPLPRDPSSVVDAVLRFVARAPAPLALIPLEDLCGLAEQPNLPGTIDEHPNWRRRLPDAATALLAAPAVAARLQELSATRQAQTT